MSLVPTLQRLVQRVPSIYSHKNKNFQLHRHSYQTYTKAPKCFHNTTLSLRNAQPTLSLRSQMMPRPYQLSNNTSLTTVPSREIGFNHQLNMQLHRNLNAYRFSENGEFAHAVFSLSSLKDVHVRDLIAIDDVEARRSGPVILPRKDCIIVSLWYVKAIIQTDKMVLLDAHRPIVTAFAETVRNNYKLMFAVDQARENELDGDSSNFNFDSYSYDPYDPYSTAELFQPSKSKSFIRDELDNEVETDGDAYEEYGQNGSRSDSEAFSDTENSGTSTSTFEFRILEALLRTVIDIQERRIRCFQPITAQILHDLTLGDHEAETVSRLLQLKNALGSFERSSEELLSVIAGLLHSNEDMLELFLTEKKRRHGALPPEEFHQDCELMLEAFHRELSQLRMEAQQLRKKISGTEDLLTITMDSQRNKMIRVQTQMAVCSVSLGLGTLMTGMFGMNLTTGLETHPNAFFAFAGLSLVLSSSVMLGVNRIMLRQPVRTSLIFSAHKSTNQSSRNINILRQALDNMPDLQDTLLQYMQSCTDGGFIDREDLKILIDDCAGHSVPEEVIEILLEMYGDVEKEILTSDNVNTFICDFPSSRWTGSA